ncbi:unnamed protein product [Paramecium octaurelia]|uniref:Uncharacterized protein n=1 Tax=Paramecium octaurelia TaxID=43137 RepID=A0A8S1W0Z4_PAROT|nr:unnamed protein product [Paramecium octaurelia]
MLYINIQFQRAQLHSYLYYEFNNLCYRSWQYFGILQQKPLTKDKPILIKYDAKKQILKASSTSSSSRLIHQKFEVQHILQSMLHYIETSRCCVNSTKLNQLYSIMRAGRKDQKIKTNIMGGFILQVADLQKLQTVCKLAIVLMKSKASLTHVKKSKTCTGAQEL